MNMSYTISGLESAFKAKNVRVAIMDDNKRMIGNGCICETGLGYVVVTSDKVADRASTLENCRYSHMGSIGLFEPQNGFFTSAYPGFTVCAVEEPECEEDVIICRPQDSPKLNDELFALSCARETPDVQYTYPGRYAGPVTPDQIIFKHNLVLAHDTCLGSPITNTYGEWVGMYSNTHERMAISVVGLGLCIRPAKREGSGSDYEFREAVYRRLCSSGSEALYADADQ